MENLSPMLQQYLMMKKEVGQETLLFFRLGDFYEMFFEDAEIVSRELELVLTSRAAGNNQKAPMCGVPHHAAQSYISRLINKGYKVAIAQQMEDPSQAKGLVKREVTQIITQGTNLEASELESVHCACVIEDLFNYYVALYDITTNQLTATTLEKEMVNLMTLFVQYNVKEVLIEEGETLVSLKENTNITITQFGKPSKIASLPKAKEKLLEYITYTQKQTIIPNQIESTQKVMSLDYVSLNNLELLEVKRANSKSYSLFNYLNKTKSSMGSRLLKEWIKYPLYDKEAILERQSRIEFLSNHYLLLEEIQTELKAVYDTERITTKIEYSSVNAQDLNRLKISLNALKNITNLLNPYFLEVFDYSNLNELVSLIDQTILEDAPASISKEPTIKEGVDETLDTTRLLVSDSNSWLLNYENSLKEKTGIKNLKVGYSKQFGYYLEVSKGQLSQIKEEYGFIRRQTLTNAERFFTEELKEQEESIVNAQSKILSIEEAIFNQLVQTLKQSVKKLRKSSKVIAEIDCLCALAEISAQAGFVKPEFIEGKQIELIGSRHPILEMMNAKNKVIENDFVLPENQQIMILTGPNMGGKSTYMRQVALSVIMAQMGCFVKAQKAKLPLFDAIYTRMGASDDIMSGHSTFMIEMIEANQAIEKATENSLILFDEIGRGTSTYDGMAIASALVTYLAKHTRAITIFSTHYHELTQLSDSYDNVVNYQVMVAEKNNEITFLYQVKPGQANRSYGIHVASLAGLPKEVIAQANEMLKANPQAQLVQSTPSITYSSKVEDELNKIDINNLTPMEGLRVLEYLQTLSKEEYE